MARRLTLWFRQILVSMDQFAQVMIVGVAYVIGLASVCPSADETISSYVGRAARRGARWARIAAAVIDRLFVMLGEQPGHCDRNVETAFLGQSPTP